MSATRNQRSETSFINGCLRTYDLNNSWNPPTSSPSGKSATVPQPSQRPSGYVPPVRSLPAHPLTSCPLFHVLPVPQVLPDPHALPAFSRPVRSLTSYQFPQVLPAPSRPVSHLTSGQPIVLTALSRSASPVTPCQPSQVVPTFAHRISIPTVFQPRYILSVLSRPARALMSRPVRPTTSCYLSHDLLAF